MSFAYIKNNSGLETDPWGTPHLLYLRTNLV